jgi:hypothetical protein
MGEGKNINNNRRLEEVDSNPHAWLWEFQIASHATETSFAKGRVNGFGKLHFYLILRNCHNHPNLQQPPPWSVSSHQHRGKTLHQQKDYYALKAQMMVSIFSNKVYLIKVCTLFLDVMYSMLNRLQYSVKITFICTGKPRNSCDSLYCSDLEPNLQHRTIKFANSWR